MCSQSPTRPRTACGKFPFQLLPWVAKAISGKPMRGALRRIQDLGIKQVLDPPLVMKQPFLIFLATHAQGYELTRAESVHKLVCARWFLDDKLAELRKLGLTFQHASCVLCIGTAGDITLAHAISFLAHPGGT